MESEDKDIVMNSTASDASDWDTRTLCSDENCIGVIGPDGRCRECGKSYDGPESPDPPPLSEPPTTVPALDRPSPEEIPSASDDPWAQRRLCSDESCIGVIGPDGRCKECGQPFNG